MVEQYIVGVAVVIASLLGFVFLAASMVFPKGNSVNKNGNSEGVALRILS
ncbi:hypothetical protein Gotur_021825 [Gossypium turneri]